MGGKIIGGTLTLIIGAGWSGIGMVGVAAFGKYGCCKRVGDGAMGVWLVSLVKIVVSCRSDVPSSAWISWLVGDKLASVEMRSLTAAIAQSAVDGINMVAWVKIQAYFSKSKHNSIGNDVLQEWCTSCQQYLAPKWYANLVSCALDFWCPGVQGMYNFNHMSQHVIGRK